MLLVSTLLIAVGVVAEERREDGAGVIENEREECDCAELSDGFPCFEYYLTGRKELPE